MGVFHRNSCMSKLSIAGVESKDRSIASVLIVFSWTFSYILVVYVEKANIREVK